MRFLADESVDFAIVHALRQAGHDVMSIAEARPGSSDDEVASLATSTNRILLTEDRDFGRLVYANQRALVGVVFMRYPAVARQRFASSVVALVESEGHRLPRTFVVVQPGRTRFGREPDA
jgi:predicted nuclease of predicted toxin-antitoxin system